MRVASIRELTEGKYLAREISGAHVSQPDTIDTFHLAVFVFSDEVKRRLAEKWSETHATKQTLQQLLNQQSRSLELSQSSSSEIELSHMTYHLPDTNTVP